MKNFPLGIYTFDSIISNNYLYVDKTDKLYKLFAKGQAVYFLSRPRRFGKSLTLSTLRAIFEGKKELFKGLAIYDKPYDWKKYPVVHLNLALKKIFSAEGLDNFLSEQCAVVAEQHGIKLTSNGCDGKFAELVRKLGKDAHVVILIDEYDKPILDNVGNLAECRKMLELLKSFYGVVKASDRYLRFAMLTGVSKFSKVSVFSDLNNLYDLTMDAEVADMLGYTQAELDHYFAGSIAELAGSEGLSREAALDKVKNWYNGYRFSDEDIKVYNPVSVMNLFQTMKFKNYWFETGTPTFLVNLIRDRQYDLEHLPADYIDETAFSTYEIENLEILPLLFQTGYLTIAECRKEFGTMMFRLDYPNFEVRESFNRRLANTFSGIETQSTSAHAYKLAKALQENDINSFFASMRVFFANVPYDIQLSNEKYYQTIFYIVFTLLGLKIEAEVRTENGRVDAVARTDTHVYIFEFKLRGDAESALEQIRERRYYEKYLDSDREIVLVGAGFDRESRNIGVYAVEKPPPHTSPKPSSPPTANSI